MALRYLIAVGRSEALKQLPPDICRWQVALDSTNCRVWVNDSAHTVRFEGKAGIILGTLFQGLRAEQVCATVGEAACTRILTSNGSHLATAYWGAYVAILLGAAPGPVQVLRDPSGGLPCYYGDASGVTLIASDVDTLIDTRWLDVTIDPDYLKRHILAFDLREPRTALTGITELLPGFQMLCGTGQPLVVPYWNPWDHVTPDNASSATQAAELRDTILSVMRSWRLAYDDVLLSVSGGLDSSILATALAQAGATVRCLTLSTGEPDGDEREKARLVTNALGFPLIEALYDLEDVDVSRSTSKHLPRPIQSAFAQSGNRIRRTHSGAGGRSVSMMGVGGDNVFCHMRSATPAIDRFLRHGAGDAFQTLSDICAMTGCSYGDALGMAFRRAARFSNSYRWKPRPGFMKPPLIPAIAKRLTHPWFEAPRYALPGKAVHIAYLAAIQGTIDGPPRDQTMLLNPLLSQPIVEACLRIPTWCWCADGQDRSVARKAFADLLPPPVLARRSKGTPETFSFEIVERNRRAIRDIIMDGRLIASGILDEARLGSALADRAVLAPPQQLDLLLLAEVEVWCRHWQQRLSTK